MLPAIESGDWLLVDPTVGRWPRRGSVVVFREPGTGELAIKRVAARPGDWVPFADGWLQLGDDEAWLLGDADDEALAAGRATAQPVDSRRYGPVAVDALVGRAWFRYWPCRRIGRIGPRRPTARARPRAAGSGCESVAAPSDRRPGTGPPGRRAGRWADSRRIGRWTTSADARRLRPRRTLAGRARSWDYHADARGRDGPPWAMTEMIAAEPGLAGGSSSGRRRRPAAALADAFAGRGGAGEPVVVTGCGTSEHAALATAAILRDAWRRPGSRARAGRRTGVRAGAGSATGGLVIGVSHEGGTTATIAALAAARAPGRGPR